MITKKRHPIITLLSFSLFFILFVLHYSVDFNIAIKNAVPLLLLPLITAFSMFNTPIVAAAAGLVTGICMDGAASNSISFNALVLMLTAAAVSVICDNLFNENINSAMLLSVLVSLLYFSLRWLVFYAFDGATEENLTYLFLFAFPSAVYTSVFIFPFYFIYKKFDRLKRE